MRKWDVRVTVTKVVRVSLHEDFVSAAGDDLGDRIYDMAQFHEVWSTAEVMDEETDLQVIKEVA